MLPLDRRLYLDVNSISRHSTWAHGFMADFALWGGLVVMVVLFAIAFLRARRAGRLDMVTILFLGGAASIVALGVNKLVSDAVQRQRPCHALHHVTVILTCASDYGFPSDHAVIAGALAIAVVTVDRKLGLVAIVFALGLAFARVYAGVHYPGDVVAGLLLGAVIALVIEVVLRAPALTGLNYLARTPLRPLLTSRAPEPVDSSP